MLKRAARCEWKSEVCLLTKKKKVKWKKYEKNDENQALLFPSKCAFIVRM